MTRIAFATLILASLAAAVPAPARALPLLSITGPSGGSTSIGENLTQQGVAQSFSVSEDLFDVDFAFDLLCLGCAGRLQLISGLPAANATIFQRVALASYTDLASAQTALSGIDLRAGLTYTIILTIESGNGIWRATQSPTLAGIGAIDPADSYLLLDTLDPNFLPWSPFSTVAGAVLKFSASGDRAAALPVPATAGLVLGALLPLVRARRRAGGAARHVAA